MASQYVPGGGNWLRVRVNCSHLEDSLNRLRADSVPVFSREVGPYGKCDPVCARVTEDVDQALSMADER